MLLKQARRYKVAKDNIKTDHSIHSDGLSYARTEHWQFITSTRFEFSGLIPDLGASLSRLKKGKMKILEVTSTFPCSKLRQDNRVRLLNINNNFLSRITLWDCVCVACQLRPNTRAFLHLITKIADDYTWRRVGATGNYVVRKRASMALAFTTTTIHQTAENLSLFFEISSWYLCLVESVDSASRLYASSPCLSSFKKSLFRREASLICMLQQVFWS